MSNMLEASRVKELNDKKLRKGKYVLYWMQSSQRIEGNHSLNYAIEKANKHKQRLLVAFGLTNFPEANNRHYKFMLEGLIETQNRLLEIGAGVSFQVKPPFELISELSNQASMLVLDQGYLRIIKKWYNKIIPRIKCKAIQVESNVVVPVGIASNKEEYSAATFRRKISKIVDKFLHQQKIPEINKTNKNENQLLENNSISNLKIDKISYNTSFRGGYREAKHHLDEFLAERLDEYHNKKNDPTLNKVSNMSPYLHFGQISPIEIALAVKEFSSKGSNAYLEELIVRRELAINFVHYNQYYDMIECLPDWCRKTLNEHKKDTRQFIYSKKEFEKAKTHDPYWNAAQIEMLKTGKMHGYMRMYWGKKIIEWSKTPEEAYHIMLYLNNKYELDGRDPNGYAGIAWCFGKHDRPWKERPIFGKIRYMNDRGLERKFKIKEYEVKWINS
jgi:deoxyribodipyrimidine photo-lyase